MPNWCDTTYRAVGTKEQVKQFYDLATRAWKENSEKHPTASKGWLGSFVDFLDGPDDVYARGWMLDEPYLRDDFEDDYAECTIYCDTAWNEPEQWRHFMEFKIDGLKIYYVAIEPGCEIYATNDDAYEGKYYVDHTPEQPDSPFMTEDELCAYIEKYYQTNVNDAADCMAFAIGFNEDNDDEGLYIHAMEVYDD